MKKLIITTLILFTGFRFFAQEERIIVIDKGSTKRSRSFTKRDVVDNSYVVKFSVLQMFANELNFSLERKIDDKSSYEISLGPTISNINFSVQPNHYTYYDPTYGNPTNETSDLGLFMSAGYRFYPMNDSKVLNRFYVSPVLKYRRMNFGVEDFSENLEPTKGSEDHLYFTFNFGYQSWLSERFCIDYFAGLGLGYESHVRYSVGTTYNPDTYLYDYYWDKNAYSGARYLFTLGLKVGIGN